MTRHYRRCRILLEFGHQPPPKFNAGKVYSCNGVLITGGSQRNVLNGNFVGTTADGDAALDNGGNGVRVDGTSRNTRVGGVIPLGNVSAGNRRNGIEVAGRVSGFVTFNTFGGLPAFKGAAPNGNDGLLITSTGGDNLARTNVFSGNYRNGVELAGNASGVTIDPDVAGLTATAGRRCPTAGTAC